MNKHLDNDKKDGKDDIYSEESGDDDRTMKREIKQQRPVPKVTE